MALTLATAEPSGEAEIFASLQGEGPSMGKPCIFIRVSRCNLACTWCDTAYTWRFDGDNRPHRDAITYDRKANQVTMSEKSASEKIVMLDNDRPNGRLVITGGEPLLQANALAQMLAFLPDMIVEVETNGTVAPPPEFDRHIAQYNISPKLAHSGNSAELALLPERLDAWAADERAFFKFVIAAPQDVDEVLQLQARHAIPRSRILLMAEGTDTAALQAREQWLAPLCISHGLTLSQRLHIQLFGDTRAT